MINLIQSENVLFNKDVLFFSSSDSTVYTNLIREELLNDILPFWDAKLKVGNIYIVNKHLHSNYNIHRMWTSILTDYSNSYLNIKYFKELLSKSLDYLIEKDVKEVVIPDVIFYNNTFDRKFLASILIDEFKQRIDKIEITFTTRYKKYLDEIKNVLGV